MVVFFNAFSAKSFLYSLIINKFGVCLKGAVFQKYCQKWTFLKNDFKVWPSPVGQLMIRLKTI